MEINLILCPIDFSEFSRVPLSLFAFDFLRSDLTELKVDDQNHYR
jgi:hypothetical protein